MSTYFDDINKDNDLKKEKEIEKESPAFTFFFYLFFSLMIVTSIVMIIINSVVFNNTLNARYRVNELSNLISNLNIISGDCWQCDSSTGILTFISQYLENENNATIQFANNDLSISDMQINSKSESAIFFDGINLISTNNNIAIKSASMMFGNSSRYAIDVENLPVLSDSTINVGLYNGDIISENSRCIEISNAVIYIVYYYNNIINSTDFNLCVCNNLIESCIQYNSSSFY